MIPDEKIPEIRERTDIVALVQQYVNLKRVGASFRGLCPFHAEKTPSFYVHPARQFFHCFGCQASGDVISFYMRLEGVSFPEALRVLADRAGVELPSLDPRAEADERRSKAKSARLVALMDAAAGYYVKQLSEHPLSHMARAELERRGVSPASAEAFRLGYAPHGWDGLASWLKQHGFGAADAEELGLLVARKSRDGHYDRFRHRLMFPVSDHMGRIVAFSGRVLDPPPDEPLSDRMEPAAKYVNSPENPLYHKGSVLYGLHEGRVEARREGWVLVCEGNFDLVALHQAGFKNAVAPLGTAFTADHARLLKRYAQRVVLLFDGDKAGRKAVGAAYPLLQAQGIAARVVRLPEGDDPDTLLRTEGSEGLERRIAAAPNVLEFLIDERVAEAGGDPAQTARSIESLGPILAQVDNPVEVRLYIERVAQKFGIADIDAVRAQLRRGVRQDRSKPRRQDPSSNASARRGDADGVRESSQRSDAHAQSPTSRRGQSDTPTSASARRLSPLECEVVGVFLDQPSLFDSEEGGNVTELLTNPDLRRIFQSAREIVTERGAIDAPTLLERLQDNSALPWLEGRLAVQEHELEAAKETLRTGIPRLVEERVTGELSRMSEEIQAARRAGDEERAMVLTRERDTLRRSVLSPQQTTNPAQR